MARSGGSSAGGGRPRSSMSTEKMTWWRHHAPGMEGQVEDRRAVPDQARAIARALASADHLEGESTDWQVWLPFGLAVYEAFPTDYVIISKREYKQLTAAAAQADVQRGAIVNGIVRAARGLLTDFLDPMARSIAMGDLGQRLQELARYDWKHEERNGR